MKKNILFYLCFMLIGGLTITSCTKDEDKNEFAEINDVRGAAINILEIQRGFFDVDLPDDEVSFSINSVGETISSADLTVSYNGGTAVNLRSLTTYPATITASLTEVAGALGLDISTITTSDVITAGFANVVTSTGTYDSGENVDLVFCKSELAGTFTYTTNNYSIPTADGCDGDGLTGTVTWTASGPGKYLSDDFGYGTYQQCWGAPAASWGTIEYVDACNELTITGADNYGDAWAISGVSVDGTSLTFTWSNDYGESGTTTLVRDDGKDWPELF